MNVIARLKIKWDFFQATTAQVLLYGGTTWTQTKCIVKKQDVKNTRTLRAVLKKALEATPHKTVTVRPLTSHLKNHKKKARTFICGSLVIDGPVLADLQELIYISSVRTLDVVWKTWRERWMIRTSGKREREGGKPGKSMLSARLDDNEDKAERIYAYILGFEK